MKKGNRHNSVGFFALITNSNNVRWLISLPEFYLCNEFSELCLEIDDNFMAVTHLFRLIIHTHHSQKLFNMLYHMRFNLVCNNFQSILRSLFKLGYTVSPRIGRTSVPKKSCPIWNRTIGVYTITYAKNRTISRKSH